MNKNTHISNCMGYENSSVAMTIVIELLIYIWGCRVFSIFSETRILNFVDKLIKFYMEDALRSWKIDCPKFIPFCCMEISN